MRESFVPNEHTRSVAQKLLEQIREGSELIKNDSEIAIVGAHQDDESIAFGSLIPRMPNCLMVHVTDGAPADTSEWKGAETREQYAHIRERESDIALERGGHVGKRVSLGSMDQGAALKLAENARQLAAIFTENRIKVAMTHAYEGGHPDHDSVAFSVHAAKELMKKKGLRLAIIEAPLYRTVNSQSIFQDFVPVEGTETVTVPLTKAQMFDKSMLYDAHRSQESVFNTQDELRKMSTEKEWLRESPEYDFSKLPNEGSLSNIYKRSGIDKEWLTLTDRALKELGLK